MILSSVLGVALALMPLSPGMLTVQVTQPTTRPAPTSRVYPPIPKDPPVKRLSAIAKGLEFIGPAVSEPDYFVWCTSPLAGDDGKTHLYVSRWPKQYRMNGWRTHCEVAHYVGDRPEGPFTFRGIAIPANPDALWNNSIHNPAISRVGNTYYLLYMSFDRRPSEHLKEGKQPMWIGMARADSPDGPWTVLTEKDPLFLPSTSPDHWSYGDWQGCNQTMLEWKGKYYIFFRGGKRLPGRPSYPYAYAVADKPEGPYRIGDKWCIDPDNKIEDATAFVWEGKIRLLTTDNFGVHTGVPGQGILWTTDDPTHFDMADAEVGYLLSSHYAAGKYDPEKVRRHYGRAFKFERPGILMRDGKPAYLYAASGFNLRGGDAPESYVLKINLE